MTMSRISGERSFTGGAFTGNERSEREKGQKKETDKERGDNINRELSWIECLNETRLMT